MSGDLLQRLAEAGTPLHLVMEVAEQLAEARAAQRTLAALKEADRSRARGYRERRGISDKGWASLVGAVIERDGLICAYCDKDMTKGGRYAVDHVLPLGRGGTNDLSNLAMACIGCNSSKRDRLVGIEWTPPKERPGR